MSAANGANDAEQFSEHSEAINDELSPEARVQFVRSIQPMLIQCCATSGCHQPGSAQSLQLDRWALMGKGNADIVRRNLAAVRRELNVDDPMASRLLQMARNPHGRGASSASRPITPRQSALLVDWLNAVAGIQPVAHEAAADANGGDLKDFGVEQAVYEEPVSDQAMDEGAWPEPPVARFRPRDDFDPEIFNRRFAELAAEVETEAAESAATELQPELLDSEPQPGPSPSAEP